MRKPNACMKNPSPSRPRGLLWGGVFRKVNFETLTSRLLWTNGFSRCYMFLPWLKHRLVRLEDVWSHMVCTHAIEARGTCEGRQLLPKTLAWKISTAPQPALAGSLCEYSVTTTTNANCEWNAMCEKMRSYRCLIININFINIVHTSPMHANSMYCEKITTYIHVN